MGKQKKAFFGPCQVRPFTVNPVFLIMRPADCYLPGVMKKSRIRPVEPAQPVKPVHADFQQVICLPDGRIRVRFRKAGSDPAIRIDLPCRLNSVSAVLELGLSTDRDFTPVRLAVCSPARKNGNIVIYFNEENTDLFDQFEAFQRTCQEPEAFPAVRARFRTSPRGF